MKRILLGLGSNRDFQGKSSLQILKLVCSELATFLENPLFSSVYRTRAMYVTDQNDFYNMAALGFVADEKSPFQLLDEIHQIEAKYGRNRNEEIRFGPRSIDIDIELFGDETVNTPELQIPHVRMEERAFVLIPSIEILKNVADVNIREKYIQCLSKIDLSDKANCVEKIISSEEFFPTGGGNNEK